MNRGTERLRPNQQVLEEASSWFIDFRSGDVDARGRKDFHDWLRRSPDHIGAYLDIASTYADLPAPGPGGLDVDALINRAMTSTDDRIVRLGSSSPLPTRRPGARRSRAALSMALTASIVLAGIATWAYTQRGLYDTGVGEQRSITLPDGSTVDMNARSTVRVRFSKDMREVYLLAGQALFQVATDQRRPFVVRSGGTQVRALGTQFDVYRKKSGTIVTVIEGRVGIVTDSGPPSVRTQSDDASPAQGARAVAEPTRPPSVTGATSAPVVLGAGEQITLGSDAPSAPRRADIPAATAWTHHRLVFEDATLSEVAEEFNRYSVRPMRVQLAGLESFHVSGTYSSANPDSLLRFMRAQPGIRVTVTDEEIRIAHD